MLRTPKKREALPDVLDRRELARLLGAIERDGVWQRRYAGRRERDRLPLALFAYAGLRRSELLGLDWDDVDLDQRLLRVRKAKGGRQRMIPIHPALAPLFASYYATRLPLDEQAVFTGVQGNRLKYTQLCSGSSRSPSRRCSSGGRVRVPVPSVTARLLSVGNRSRLTAPRSSCAVTRV